mgnify:CR=1 FL=1
MDYASCLLSVLQVCNLFFQHFIPAFQLLQFLALLNHMQCQFLVVVVLEIVVVVVLGSTVVVVEVVVVVGLVVDVEVVVLTLKFAAITLVLFIVSAL